MPRQALRETLVLTVAATALAGLLLALCPTTGPSLRRLFAIFDSRYVSSEVAPMPFDRDLWRAGKAGHRVAMAHDLADKKRLDGKTRAELVEMLGEPDLEKPGPDGTRWLLGYYAKGLFDEGLWLEVTIDDDGTASGAVVAVDWYDPRRH